jgi:hypothetical protein
MLQFYDIFWKLGFIIQDKWVHQCAYTEKKKSSNRLKLISKEDLYETKCTVTEQ